MLLTPERKRRLAGWFLLAGSCLWVAGVVIAMVGQTAPGAVVRCAGLAVLYMAGLLRPSLLLWTFLAMLGGTELGMDAPRVAVETRFLGDLFLRLIRMIIAPLLIATITTGIAGHSELRSLRRVALKAIV